MGKAQRRLEQRIQEDGHAGAERKHERSRDGTERPAGDRGPEGQIAEEIAWFFRVHRPLLPAMKIRYDRIAMAGIADPSLRITFDRNLQWSMRLDLRDGAEGEPLLQPQQVLMEVKIQGAMRPDMARALSERGVFPASFSISGSASIKSLPSLSAKQRPSVLFPQPGIPISTIFFITSTNYVQTKISGIVNAGAAYSSETITMLQSYLSRPLLIRRPAYAPARFHLPLPPGQPA